MHGAHAALRPGGSLVFETRDPVHRGWREWSRAASYRITEIPGAGNVESSEERIEVALPLVSFRWTWVFSSDGQVLTSDSTLRFRGRDEIEADLAAQGYVVSEVRQAPDRPGKSSSFSHADPPDVLTSVGEPILQWLRRPERQRSVSDHERVARRGPRGFVAGVGTMGFAVDPLAGLERARPERLNGFRHPGRYAPRFDP